MIRASFVKLVTAEKLLEPTRLIKAQVPMKYDSDRDKIWKKHSPIKNFFQLKIKRKKMLKIWKTTKSI